MCQPVNFQHLDPTAIETAVGHALDVISLHAKGLAAAEIAPDDASVLELGPGSDFGPALVLASLGARVTVADRFLAPWRDEYHRRLYRRLAEVYEGPKAQLLAAAEGGYEATTLIRIAEPAEALNSIPSASIDFVYSGAVLEHVQDAAAVTRELARITRPGGKGYHIIDVRYHRDFSRPLDHLLMPEDQFLIAAEDCQYEFGNRLRASEFDAHFAAAGFKVCGHVSGDHADERYLRDLIPALRQAPSSYRFWPATDLSDVGPRFLVEKLAGASAEALMTGGRKSLALMAALKEAGLAGSGGAPGAWDHHDIELTPDTMKGPDGQGWIAASPAIPDGDSVSQGFTSQAVLLEDGKTLGPAHAMHDDIRARGAGRFSHWQGSVYFSTSDGTSPLENGRRYVLRIPRG